MSTIAIEEVIETTRKAFGIPATPRGRALQTLDWYANGKRNFSNYDDPRIQVRDIVRGR
jgi:hypothetical protein